MNNNQFTDESNSFAPSYPPFPLMFNQYKPTALQIDMGVLRNGGGAWIFVSFKGRGLEPENPLKTIDFIDPIATPLPPTEYTSVHNSTMYILVFFQ